MLVLNELNKKITQKEEDKKCLIFTSRVFSTVGIISTGITVYEIATKLNYQTLLAASLAALSFTIAHHKNKEKNRLASELLDLNDKALFTIPETDFETSNKILQKVPKN